MTREQVATSYDRIADQWVDASTYRLCFGCSIPYRDPSRRAGYGIS